jgi:Zn-finger nucleic acid-binding protein
MAHCSEEELEASIKEQTKEIQEQKTSNQDLPGSRWFLQRNNEWFGPFSLAEIGSLNWVSLQTPFKTHDATKQGMVKDEPILKTIVWNQRGNNFCPVCSIELQKMNYENEQIRTCYSCQGALLNENQAGVILIRRMAKIPSNVYDLARGMLAKQVDKSISWQKVTESQNQNSFLCPNCSHRMQTRLFNAFHPVVIDKCLSCGSIWFEEGELDLIQAMYEIHNSKS